MAQSFGVGFVIGASVAASVTSAFSTVSEKIKTTQAQMGKARREAAVLDKAIALSRQKTALEQQSSATGGKDSGLEKQLASVTKRYNEARKAALAYGSSVAAWEASQRKAAASLETLTRKRNLYQAMEGEKKTRAGLKQDILSGAPAVMTVAAPIQSAISFESAMADAAKTIDGMRDSSGNLTPEYYKMEEAVKNLGDELPLAHEQIAALFAAGGQQGQFVYITHFDHYQKTPLSASHPLTVALASPCDLIPRCGTQQQRQSTSYDFAILEMVWHHLDRKKWKAALWDVCQCSNSCGTDHYY